MEVTVVDGNGTETGHIIVTTIGGKNGQPKQVILICNLLFWTILVLESLNCCRDAYIPFCDCRLSAIWLSVLLEMDHLE